MEQVTGQWSVNQGRSSPTWRKTIEEKSAEEQMTRSIRLLPFHRLFDILDFQVREGSFLSSFENSKSVRYPSRESNSSETQNIT